MGPTKELVDALFWDRVRRAQAMTGEEKIGEGFRLYERALTIMRAGIRNENPGAKEDQVEMILRERLALLRRIEEVA